MTGFWMAWTMFWIVPCPVKKWDNEKYSQVPLWIPVIGLFIGGLWTLLAFLLKLAGGLGFFGPVLLFAFCSVMSGFIHLDGFMDCADAVLSHRNLEEKYRILKDSTTGAFAVICIILWAVCYFALTANAALLNTYLYDRFLCLIFIPAAIRCVSAIAVTAVKPLGTSGYAASHKNVRPVSIIIPAVILAVCIAVPIIIYGLPGLCVCAGAFGSFIAVLYLVHNLKGMSGDISGAAITFGEVCAMAALAFIK